MEAAAAVVALAALRAKLHTVPVFASSTETTETFVQQVFLSTSCITAHIFFKFRNVNT